MDPIIEHRIQKLFLGFSASIAKEAFPMPLLVNVTGKRNARKTNLYEDSWPLESPYEEHLDFSGFTEKP